MNFKSGSGARQLKKRPVTLLVTNLINRGASDDEPASLNSAFNGRELVSSDCISCSDRVSTALEKLMKRPWAWT